MPSSIKTELDTIKKDLKTGQVPIRPKKSNRIESQASGKYGFDNEYEKPTSNKRNAGIWSH